MKVLVTGGAGYVGSIVAEKLVLNGYDVYVLDNLSQGHLNAITKGAKFIRADLNDIDALSNLFEEFKLDAVMHMAADSIIEKSMRDPDHCFRNNLIGGLNLLNVMKQYNVKKIIFSSSAAIYGKPRVKIIEECHAKRPINAYGESKLIFEQILSWYKKAYGLKYVCLRYFNAAGASESHGEDHRPESHLIPNLLFAAFKDHKVNVYGTDYPTKDGSCVRDYVHVLDIAQAHVLALEKISSLRYCAFNLGNSEGYSVVEVIDATKRITGVDLDVQYGPRRAGDPAILVASSQLASRELGWAPSCSDIEGIIETAWQWIKKNPNGYER